MATTVVDPFLVAAPVAIVPAMAGVWWMLHRYEGLLDEARIFFSLVVGLFIGVAAAAMEAALFAFPGPDFVGQHGPLGSLLFTVVGYALFETGAKAIFLGMARFRTRPDTPFYGVPLGLAMGAMMAMHHMTAWMEARSFDALGLVTMAAVPLSAVFVHGAAGAWVGRGSAQGRLAWGWAVGMAVQMPALAALWFALQSPADLLLAGGAVAYAAFTWWWVRRRLLEKVVPKDIQDLVRRDKRRALRRNEDDDQSEA